MYLNDMARLLIDALRGEDGDAKYRKASICDAMSVILFMYQMHASDTKEKEALIDALDVLVNYNELITELSKEKEV